MKNMIKRSKIKDQKRIIISNKLTNLLNEIKKDYKYIVIDNFDDLINSIKNLTSTFFPDFINFRKVKGDQKFIDPIYQETIQVHEDLLPLIYSSPLQRLNHIRQLSFAYLEYKGANHTRFDHTLGVYYLTDVICERVCTHCNLKYTQDERKELLISSLFHDIGHSPFSHSVEFILNDLDLNDKLLAKDIISKYYKEFINDNLGLNINNVLVNISPIDDIRKINEKQQISKTLIDGALDVDRVDYIRRDFFYCLGDPPGLRYYLSEAGYCKDKKNSVSMFALRDSADSLRWIQDMDESRRNAYKRIYESDFSAYSDEILIHALFYFCKKYLSDLGNEFEKTKLLINELIKLSDNFLISLLFLLGDEKTKNLIKKIQFRDFFMKIGFIDINELGGPEKFNSNFYYFTLRGKEKQLRALEKIEFYEKRIKQGLDLSGNIFISLPKFYVPIDERKDLCDKNPDLVCVPLVKSFNELTDFRLYHSSITEGIKIFPTRRQDIYIYIDNEADLSKTNKILNKVCELIIHNFNPNDDYRNIIGIHKAD